MKGNGHKQPAVCVRGQDAPSPAELERWVVVGRGRRSTFVKPVKGAKTLGDLRHALRDGARTVQLADDVARVFTDSAAVNRALRKLIEAFPAAHANRKKSA